MEKLRFYQASRYLKTLSIDNGTSQYQLNKVIILDKGKELFTRQAYDVFNNGDTLDIERSEVNRRLKVDTGIKNKDILFVVRHDSPYSYDVEYDLYINNDFIKFKLKEVKQYINDYMYESVYYSEVYDIEASDFKRYRADDKTEEKIGRYIGDFIEAKDNFISTLSTLEEVEEYAKQLVKTRKKLDKYEKIRLNQMLKYIEELNN